MPYDVPVIPQSTTMSCWAASIAMILAWRDQASYDPGLIARNPGGVNYMPSMQQGLDPNDTYILKVNGFEPLAPQCFEPEAISHLLLTYGPLWVASWAPGPHIRVVTGLAGDQVYINDPAPVNKGSQYILPFNTFFGAMEDLGQRESAQAAPVYVARLRVAR